MLCKELQASICKSKLFSKVTKVFYSSWVVVFRTCISKHIPITFSSIFSFSLSKYSTFFVDLTNISLRKAYMFCTFDSFVVGTPYGQQVHIQPSTLHTPSTTLLTSIASSLRFEQTLVLDLNFSNSLCLDFFLFVVVTVTATQLMGIPLAFAMKPFTNHFINSLLVIVKDS